VKQQYDWNYTTTPQPGLNGRSLAYARGRILGGSSTISKLFSLCRGHIMHTSRTRPDYMIYNTGSRDDWDYINRITGDPAWTWDAMAPYRDLNQKYVAPNDHHNDVSQKQAFSLLRSYYSSQTSQYLPSAHSRNGTVPISLPGYMWPIDPRVAAATTEPSFVSEFPFQRDMNTGNPVCSITSVVLSRLIFDWLSFWGTDWFWLGTGHHSQRPAVQFCHHLHRTKIR